MLSGLSLRARLLLGVIVLAALGLAAADVATYTSLRSFLLERTDSTLEAAHHGVEGALFRPGPPDMAALTNVARGDYIQVRTTANEVLSEGMVSQYPGEGQPPAPRLSAKIALGKRPADGGDVVRYFTARSVSGSDRWRVRASIEPRASSYILVLAASLKEVDRTLHRLVVIEVLVTLAVLAALIALGLWAVRLGLKPLEAMGETAAAIAGGELSRRVEPAEPRTEVGRLGLALNAMLSQIESAFKAREASERRLRRFVADASHELRTPLAAVRGYAELFGRGADRRPEDLARTMDGISRESERMSRLVEDLLLLARLDEGRPLAHAPVELDQLVGEAVETAQTVEPGREIELTAEPAVVLGDRDRLRQVVDNLLSNVRAHTPPGTPVRVGVATNDGHAVIEVADTGPGLPPDTAERVFERFYRVDASRSRASGGVGLGLSIVAAVTEAHGGTFAARSEPGEGATFAITLPLIDATDNASSTATAS
jgi:two-component system, OmpR family, sensor kinase